MYISHYFVADSKIVYKYIIKPRIKLTKNSRFNLENFLYEFKQNPYNMYVLSLSLYNKKLYYHCFTESISFSDIYLRAFFAG